MNLVTIENVTKQYSERVLLDGVDLMINTGERIGLIGRNGSGKTTLLRLVAGLESADSGTFNIWGKVRVRYLSQADELDLSLTVLDTIYQSISPQMQLLRRYELAHYELQQMPHDEQAQKRFFKVSSEMDLAGGWSAETNAKIILSKLGIEDYHAYVNTLSGGQQKRVALARALIDPTDLLILDEPTNHIDAETITWLEEYLTSIPNALLMVTHDRYFLDRVTNQIVELDRRKLVKYVGNYTAYLEQRAEREEQLAQQEEKRKSMLKRELAWLHRAPQARGTKQKARIQRVQEMAGIRHDRGSQRLSLALASRRLGKKVLSAKNLSVAFDGKTLFEGVNFHLEQGERIGILGPNGAGKSTLLNLLAGQMDSPTGSIVWGETAHLGYYDQKSGNLVEDMRVIEFISNAMPLIYTKDGEKIEAAQMLELFLFTRPEQQSRIRSLSGGERRRLYLLHVLMNQPNVLFLDEPTNDLDIQTLQVLEQFLDNFKGSLVVVSHDRYFLDRNVDFLYVFAEGEIGSRYPGPYAAYRATVEAQKSQVRTPKAVVNKSPKSTPKKGSKLTWKEKRELEGLDDKMAELEAQKEKIAAAINAAGSDYVKLARLSEKLEAVGEALDSAELRWLELSELAEE